MVWTLLNPAVVHLHRYAARDHAASGHAEHQHHPATHDHLPRLPAAPGQAGAELHAPDPAAHAVFFTAAVATAGAAFALAYDTVEGFELTRETTSSERQRTVE